MMQRRVVLGAAAAAGAGLLVAPGTASAAVPRTAADPLRVQVVMSGPDLALHLR